MAVIKKESHQTWIGTAAEMALFTSMQAGDKFITTDTKLEYEYTGAAWIIKSTGVQLSGSNLTESYVIPMFDLLAWSGFTNQPDGDDVEIVSDNAGDTGKCTVFYTKKSDGTFAYATVTLTGVTAKALTGATDVDDVLGVFLGDIEGKNITPAVGTITLREASGDQAITTIVATKISKGLVAFDLTGKQIILNVHSGNVWKRCSNVASTTTGFKMNLTGGNIKEEKIASMLYLISDTTGATAQIEVLA